MLWYAGHLPRHKMPEMLDIPSLPTFAEIWKDNQKIGKTFVRKKHLDEDLINVTKSIIESIFTDAKFIPDLEKDRFEILKLYYDSPKKNNVANLYPHLVKEWNTEKNQGLTPDVFTLSSHFKVWWKCSKGHEWIAPIYSRTHGGTQCPYCYRHLLLPGFNDLKT